MTDSNSTKREQIKKRIRALLSLTVERGATEGEAMNAAALAGKLMADYDLTYTDIENEVRAERYGMRGKKGYVRGSKRRRSFHEVHDCIVTIATFFDCKVWTMRFNNNGDGGELIYLGSETDTEFAHAMTDMIRIAMETEFASYLHKNRGVAHGRKLHASFLIGMADRINERLEEIIKERTAAVPSRNALMVIRNDVVTSIFAKLSQTHNITSGGQSIKRIRDENAYAAGQEAGNNVALRQDVQVGRQGVIGNVS